LEQSLKASKEGIIIKLYLNLLWSTNAIAIYFPDNTRIEISSALIDLHCKKTGIGNFLEVRAVIVVC